MMHQPYVPQPWTEQGLCREVFPAAWFPEPNEPRYAADAGYLGRDHAPAADAEATDAADLLELVADTERATGRDAVAAFLAACEADARAHDGRVSVNRVSAALEAEGIEHHRYSAFWSHFTGRGKPMVKCSGEWEVRAGSKTGNNGKPFVVRRWVA